MTFSLHLPWLYLDTQSRSIPFTNPTHKQNMLYLAIQQPTVSALRSVNNHLRFRVEGSEPHYFLGLRLLVTLAKDLRQQMCGETKPDFRRPGLDLKLLNM